nr:D-glycero-beta-D-manno-heptose 1,7-bisphosphate 7-phosphatase [Desulfobotulus pelophilus]
MDRDGVINEDSPNYIRSVQAFRFIPGSAEAIGRLSLAGMDIMLVTNQSVIHRGLVTKEGLNLIFDHLRQGLVEFGGRVKAVFYCPHRPDENCSCRKPRPGLFFRAETEYGVDLAASIMVGDSAKDMEAARAAGVGILILVRTGNGRRDLPILMERGLGPDYVAENLAGAVDWILKDGRLPSE